MELSVSAWCLQKKLYEKEITIYDFIRFCFNNKVKHVELLDCFIGDETTGILKLLRELDMKVSCYSIGNDFVYSTAQQRESEIANVKNSIDKAVQLQTKLLRVFSGNVKDDIPFASGKKWIIEGFKSVINYAEEKDITLVLENHGFFAGKSDQVSEIIDLVCSTHFKSTSDVGNFLLVEEDPLDAIKNLGSKIGYIHFKDFKHVGEAPSVYRSISGKHYQGTVLGAGDVPLPAIVDHLDKIGYGGYLSIEYEGVEDPLKGTAESIQYAKSIMK